MTATTGGAAVAGNLLNLPLADQGTAMLRFENGAAGLIKAGWTYTARRLDIDLIGTEGHIMLQHRQITPTPRGSDQPAQVNGLVDGMGLGLIAP